MIAIALAAFLQTAAHAAPTPPAGATQMSPQQQREAMTNALRARGMSPSGIAAIQAGAQRGQAFVKSMLPKLQASVGTMRATASAKPFNAGAFEAALRAQSTLAAQLQAQQAEHQIAVLKTLSPADQQVYAELLVRQPPPGH